MLPRNIQTSLLAAQLVAFATLARSVAYDRWFTVVVSSLMIVGALAATRHRTWGVALSFAAAVTIAFAAFIGIAPLWFVAVGAIGALPFLLTSEALGRFDRQATNLLAGLATGIGAGAAVAWKLVAWEVFLTFPALMPGLRAQHGLAVTAVLALGALVAFAQRDRQRGAQLRVADVGDETRFRIADVEHTAPSDVQEEEAQGHEEAHAAMRAGR
ncbi:MAG: hypothetical protein WKG00_17425 [Polyangiaceae bacterium]